MGKNYNQFEIPHSVTNPGSIAVSSILFGPLNSDITLLCHNVQHVPKSNNLQLFNLREITYLYRVSHRNCNVKQIVLNLTSHGIHWAEI